MPSNPFLAASTTMAAAKPVIFLVTGAWHIPEHYHLVSNDLRHQGYTVECPLLKTNNNAIPPNITLDDDVQQIRSLALSYLESGRDIVALMHSYGGVVGSNAFADLGALDERTTTGCVRALIYMTAFIPFEHESLADIFDGGLPPFLTPNDRGLIDITDPEFQFYNDLPAERQSYYASRLAVHPTVAQFKAMRKPPARAAWRSIPVIYIVCTDDKSLPPQVQEMMVSRIEKAQQGLVVKREYCAAGHSPFLSMPDSIVAIVRRVCEGEKERSGRATRDLLTPAVSTQSIPESNAQVVSV